jgi:hypothetical protein
VRISPAGRAGNDTKWASTSWAHPLQLGLVRCISVPDTYYTSQPSCGRRMNNRSLRTALRAGTIAVLLFCAAIPLVAAMRNWAVIVAVGSKLQDISLADLSKYCKGTQRTWPDGRPFALVVRNPDGPEMQGAMGKILGATPAEQKPATTKQGEVHVIFKVVDTDEDLIRTVGSTPGAIGLVDVYSINSSVKVLRVDGKLPFDPGYALKVN